MTVLIDTSVWVAHFRSSNNHLTRLVAQDLAVTHPMVVLEIACGTPPLPRQRTLSSIGYLQTCNQAGFSEVVNFIEAEKLFGLGCGLVDLVLLASTLITPGCRLWTLDRRLDTLSQRFGINYQPILH